MQAIDQSVSGDKFQSLLSVMGGGNGPGGEMGSAVAQMLAGAMNMGGQQTAQRPAKRRRAKPKVASAGSAADKRVMLDLVLALCENCQLPTPWRPRR